MAQADDYTVTLDANTKPYEQNMGSAVSATQGLTAALAAAGEQMNSLWKRADRKLTFITAANVASLTAAGLAAARLDQQMEQLQARTVMVDQKTNAYNSTVATLRKTLGMTGADAISLVTNLNRLNVPFTKQQETAKSYAQLAAVTGENINGLAQSQQQFIRTMGTGQGAVQRYSSMVANLSQNYGAGAQSTLDFANSIAPLSKTMGMSAQQITGISAAFSKAGADGGAAANVYTKVLSDINRSIQYGSPELEAYSDILGVTVDQFKAMPKAEVITGIFKELNAQGPQGIKTLERLGLEGVRSQKAIQAVVTQGGLGEGIRAADKGWADPGKFGRAADEAMSGFFDTMSKAGQGMQVFAQGVGSVFVPAMEKVANVINPVAQTLATLGNAVSNMPDLAKWAGAAVLGLGALVPMLPKILSILTATSLIPAIGKGSLGQGFLLGRSPNRQMSEAQKTFAAGGGNAVYRKMFSAAMYAGDMFNPVGARGRLDDVEFTKPGPEGGKANVTSGWARGADWLAGRGILPPDYAEQMAKAQKGVSGGIRKGAIGGINILGGLVTENLRPWTGGYLEDSAKASQRSPNALTQASRFRDTDVGQSVVGAVNRLGFGTSREGVAMNMEATKAAAAGASKNFRELGKTLNLLGTNGKSSSTVMGQLARSLGQVAVMGAKAGAGMVGGTALGLAGAPFRGGKESLAYKAGAGALGLVGGPAGLALMGGTAAIGLGVNAWADSRATRKQAFVQEQGVDNAPGATYREALGEASKATRTFAKAMEDAGIGTVKAVTGMNDALTITAEQAKTAYGRMDLIEDQYVKSASKADVERYATATLSTASPEVANKLKMDVAARFGQTEGNQLLKTAYQNRGQMQNLFGAYDQVNAGGDWYNSGVVHESLFLSDKNKATSEMIKGALGSNIARAAETGGAEEAGRVQQAQLAGYGAEDLRARRSGTDHAPVRRQRRDNILSSFGVTEDDKASREALDRVMEGVEQRSRGVTDPKELEKIFAEGIHKGLANTTLGYQISEAEKQGGVVSSANYQMKGNADLGNLANFGSQMVIDRLRTTEAGRVATNQDPNGQRWNARENFNAALGGEANEDMQVAADVSMAQQLIADAGGDFTKAAGQVQLMGNASGAATDKINQHTNAIEAMIMAERQYANVMGGKTTLNDQMLTGAKDFGNQMQTFAAAPNAPDNKKNLKAAVDANMALRMQGQEEAQQLADQFVNVQWQREQGEVQLARTRSRMLRDFNQQQAWGEEDFARQREINLRNFNLQRKRAQEDFDLQRSYSIEDFERSRREEEEDHHRMVKRNIEEQAKTMYNAYQRVTVQRTWSSGSLLQNMEDQQKRMIEQQENLAEARKKGLSDQAISQLGLNEAANAQQLERLMPDLNDPKVVAQYNKAVKSRIKETGKLVQDESNLSYQQQEEDRERNLKRSDSAFYRGLDRSSKAFVKSMKRQKTDMETMNDDQIEQFDINRARQRKQMEQGWKDMKADFDFQMELQIDNINHYAEKTARSWEENRKIIAENTSGLTKEQTTATGKLMDKLDEQIVAGNEAIAGHIYAVYNEWGLTPSKKNVNSTQAGAHGPGGSHAATGGSEDVHSDHAAVYAGGWGGPTVANPGSMSTGSYTGNDASAGRGYPTTSHAQSAKYGDYNGKWSGSNSLGRGYHSGTDFPNPSGTNIYAAADGTVAFRGWNSAYGNFTKIDHGNNLQTWYAHQSAQNVSTGDKVKKGEHIGDVGQTGNATGPHLHFEVRVKGMDKDPMKWLKGASTTGGSGTPSTPLPDFAKAKPFVDYEKLLASMDFMNKDWVKYRNSFFFRQHALAEAVQKDFDKKLAEKQAADAAAGAGTAGGVDSGGKGGARGIWNALRTGGLSEKQAAGVMGNMWSESNLIWNIVQGGKRSSSTSHSQGYGLVQWTPGTKLGEILKKAGRKNNLENQVWALIQQLNGKGPHAESAAGKDLKKQTTVLGATASFLKKYERAADTSDSNAKRRNKKSEEYYKLFKGDALPSNEFGSSEGSSAGSGPSKGGKKMVHWHNGEFTEKFANTLKKAQQHFTKTISVFQGGWRPRTQASGYSHEADAIDAGPTGSKKEAFALQKALRNAGVAAWVRGHWATTSAGTRYDDHVHGVPKSDDYGYVNKNRKSSGAYWQQKDYARGGDGLATGTPSATPGWKLVGERGYEFVKLKGGEEVLNHTQSKMAVMAGKAGQVVKPGITTNNYSYDHSVRVDSVQVVSNDPNKLLKQLEAEARMAALTAPRKSKT
jgi:TP901 family phage tail tape measure protein